jgi:hypothetical protein
MILIYFLIDPATVAVVYVGKTIDPPTRLDHHTRDAGNTKKGRWATGLRESGRKPIMEEAEWVEFQEGVDAEKFWIAYHRSCGATLLNMTDGGDGGYIDGTLTQMWSRAKKAGWTPEVRARHSVKKTGSKRSPESLVKFSASMTGRKLSEETKRKISESHKGLKHTPESLAKMKAWKRKPMTPEQLERHTETNKARTPHPNSITALVKNRPKEKTPEQIQKHRKSMTGFQWSEEALQNRAEGVRKALKGKPRSDEAKAKISAGWAARKAAGIKRKPPSPEDEARRIAAIKATHARKRAALMSCET